MRIARELGSQLSLGRSLRALGDALSSEIYSDQKGTDPNPRRLRANEMYRRAIAIFEEMGHELELAKSYAEYGRYLAEAGDPEARDANTGSEASTFAPARKPVPPRHSCLHSRPMPPGRQSGELSKTLVAARIS